MVSSLAPLKRKTVTTQPHAPWHQQKRKALRSTANKILRKAKQCDVHRPVCNVFKTKFTLQRFAWQSLVDHFCKLTQLYVWPSLYGTFAILALSTIVTVYFRRHCSKIWLSWVTSAQHRCLISVILYVAPEWSSVVYREYKAQDLSLWESLLKWHWLPGHTDLMQHDIRVF